MNDQGRQPLEPGLTLAACNKQRPNLWGGLFDITGVGRHRRPIQPISGNRIR